MAGKVVLALALAVDLVLWLAGCNVSGERAVSKQATRSATEGKPAIEPLPSATPPSVQVAVSTGSSSNLNGPGAYRYRVEYPQLEGDVGKLRAINATIQSTIQRDITAFMGAASSGPAATGLSELDCKSRTVRAGVSLAVLRVDCAENHPGVANTSSHTFNCDLRRGRVLALQDLFTQGSQYLNVLSEAAGQQLRSQLPPDDQRALADVTAPIVDNFKNFLLQEDALVIVFAKLRAPPGAAGPPEVDISYRDLERYFAPGIKQLVAG